MLSAGYRVKLIAAWFRVSEDTISRLKPTCTRHTGKFYAPRPRRRVQASAGIITAPHETGVS